MKRILIVSTFLLLIAIVFSACEKRCKNKGSFAKNIPECIKESIKKDCGVVCTEEYFAFNGTNTIYRFIMKDVVWEGTPMHYPDQAYDENCNFILLQTEEHEYNSGLSGGEVIFAYLLSNGTIEYDDVIYNFKRIVFTQK
jgi:hypothetical protein